MHHQVFAHVILFAFLNDSRIVMRKASIEGSKKSISSIE